MASQDYETEILLLKQVSGNAPPRPDQRHSQLCQFVGHLSIRSKIVHANKIDLGACESEFQATTCCRGRSRVGMRPHEQDPRHQHDCPCSHDYGRGGQAAVAFYAVQRSSG